jgi:hypothetical protein
MVEYWKSINYTEMTVARSNTKEKSSKLSTTKLSNDTQRRLLLWKQFRGNKDVKT